MSLHRFVRHLTHSRIALNRAFPARSLTAIEQAITQDETRHSGQIRFAIETALDWHELRQGLSARERAIQVFSGLRVWDTEENNGVLIYLLLAERNVEIIGDRGIHRRIGDAVWESICQKMESEFRLGRFEQGAIAGIHAVGDQLAAHFPPRQAIRDELPNRPVIL